MSALLEERSPCGSATAITRSCSASTSGRYAAGAGRTYRLRLFLDTAYPGIIDNTRAPLARCFAGNRVGVSRSSKGSTTIVSVYSRHLPCLFPQHGPGKKHERPIVLEEWQRRCVDQAPMNFIRGCIESDGCYFVNRTGPYSYPSYQFATVPMTSPTSSQLHASGSGFSTDATATA